MTTPTKQSLSGSPAGKSRAPQVQAAGKNATFRNAVAEVAARYGVLVGTAPSTSTNVPKPMSAKRAVEIARRAGIITKQGKLSTRYK